MAYEKVSDLSTDTVVKLGGLNSKTGKPNPTTIEGYFLGSREVKSETGISVIHIFQTPKGNEGIWGTADINNKLAQLTPGTMTLVNYKEKRKLAGGKTKHVYDVMFDKENTIEVVTPKSQTFAQPNSDADEEYVNQHTGSAVETLEEDNSQDEEVVALEAASAAARKAKVQALLNKNRKA